MGASILNLLVAALIFVLQTTQVDAAVTASFDGDSWLNEANKNQNNGASSTIKIKGSTSTDKYGWYKFTVSGISGSGVVTDVLLKIYNDDVNAEVKVYEADASQTESTVTWNNHGGLSAVLGQTTPSGPGFFTISLTASHFAIDGAYAFVVKTDSSASSKNFISANGGQTPELLITSTTSSPTQAPTGCDHTASAGSLANINSALALASNYDTVCLETGIYLIGGGTINMKKGIKLKGLGANPSQVILDNTANSWVVMLYDSDSQITDATFENLEFRNIGIEVGTDSPALAVKNVSFDSVVFRMGIWQETTNCGKGDHYIHFEAVDGGLVIDSSLYREAPTAGGDVFYGRGITDQDSNSIQIINNVIGGNDATEALSTGYFVTAINSKGVNGVIDGNTIFRNDQWNDASNTNLKDHGIYANGFQDLKIENNVIGGWDVSAGGAGLKVRSGDGAKITGNLFFRSGIMLTVSGKSYSTATFDGDSWLNEANKNQNNGASTTIKMKGGTTSDKYGWFKFDIQNLGTIKDAKLSIFNDDVTAEVEVYEADNGRTESDVTWNNHGGQSTLLGQKSPSPKCDGSIDGYFDIPIDETHFSGSGKYAFVVKTQSSASSKNFLSSEGGFEPILRLDDGSSTQNDLNRVYVYDNVVNVDPNTPEPQLSAWGGGIGLEKFDDHGQTAILIDSNTVADGRVAVFGENNAVDATEFNAQFSLFGTTYSGGVTNNDAEDGYYILPPSISQSGNV